MQPNIIIIGASCFDGMASSNRVRNLFEPLISKKLVTVSNLVYQKDSKGLKEKRGRSNNINYRVIGFRKSNPFSIFTFNWGGLIFIAKHKSAKDKNILYIYDHPDLRNILFIFFGKMLGFKVTLDIIEDNRFYSDFNRLLTRIKVKSSVFLIKKSYLFSDAIFAISHYLLREMELIAKNRLPVYLIPITVNLEKFPVNAYQVPETFKIFYGGSFGNKDGIENLIKAFEHVTLNFNHVNLILTGKGAEYDMQSLHQLIENSHVKEKIIFKGFLEDKEYFKLINECDIFCMTRVNSSFANAGFPFKLGEFLATGKAVIATNIGEITNYLSHNKSALVINPGSIEELQQAILFLLNDPKKISKIGLEGRAVAETYFGTEKISLQLLSIFEKL